MARLRKRRNQARAQRLSERNLCPVCPRGVSVASLKTGLLNTNQDPVACCPRRKTVTSTSVFYRGKVLQATTTIQKTTTATQYVTKVRQQIGGTVFTDGNNNGIYDSRSDTVLANQVLSIYILNPNVENSPPLAVITVTTDASGRFSATAELLPSNVVIISFPGESTSPKYKGTANARGEISCKAYIGLHLTIKAIPQVSSPMGATSRLSGKLPRPRPARLRLA